VSRADGTVTWRELLTETADVLGDRREARWICEQASGAWGDEWTACLDEPATVRMVQHLDAMVARRRSGEPVQYVLGSWPFRSIDLMVDRRVLIPRPETEEVAGHAIEVARTLLAKQDHVVVADLGTGSGAIGLSVAYELPIGRSTVWCTDVSSDALDVCRANLAGLGRRAGAVTLAQGSWFDALPEEIVPDIVVSNPPYIDPADGDIDRAVSEYEPHLALFATDDGLEHYRTIVHGAVQRLAPHGTLVLEIGHRQRGAVVELCLSAGFAGTESFTDLAGRDRMVVARLQKS
jgi:release factor glutamine methyltransferase